MRIGLTEAVMLSAGSIIVGLSVGTYAGVHAEPAPVQQVNQSVPQGIQHDAQPNLHGVVEHAALTPCATEDDHNCYWNARKQGNGRGHSHYNIRVELDQCVIYWSKSYNRTHGHCYGEWG